MALLAMATIVAAGCGGSADDGPGTPSKSTASPAIKAHASRSVAAAATTPRPRLAARPVAVKLGSTFEVRVKFRHRLLPNGCGRSIARDAQYVRFPAGADDVSVPPNDDRTRLMFIMSYSSGSDGSGNPVDAGFFPESKPCKYALQRYAEL
jgi:hypothetical protein